MPLDVGEVSIPNGDPCIASSGGIERRVCMLDDQVPDSCMVLVNELALFTVSDRKWLVSLNVDMATGLKRA